mmetsp:Transcript_107169/g.130765  ORF Transcript_107169/g.130765 Transcript_107169/m.130765 type:complete len:207 (+) Transcript_107169:535-1155(+)
MPTEGNYTIHALVLSKEDREARLHLRVLHQHLAEEAKLWAQCQGLQSQAQHTIEVEMAKGVLRHLGGQDYSEIHTARALPSFSRSQANVLTDKLPLNFASAESDGHLISLGCVCTELCAIVFNVHRGVRLRAVVTFVFCTCRARASSGGQDQMSRPCVKHDCEGLVWSTHVHLTKVGSFISHRLTILLDWYILFLQRNAMDGSCLF